MMLLLWIKDEGIPSIFSQQTLEKLRIVKEVVLAEVSKLNGLVMNNK